MMNAADRRWWGWGTVDRSEPLESRPLLGPTLRAWLGLPAELPGRETAPVELEGIELRESRLDDPMLASLRKTLGDGAVQVDAAARVTHSYGRSYGDLLRLRAGRVERPPDAVVLPADEGDVVALLSWCAERDVAVIPFGGGTGLAGTLEPAEGDNPAVSLDLRALDRLLSLNRESRLATVQAGARGGEIERLLNQEGLTLGQLPQSAEFSTVGGWAATGAAGHGAAARSSIKGGIRALRLVTPAGIVDAERIASCRGQEGLVGLLLGSEGSLGVITEAITAVRPMPQERDVRALAFARVDDAFVALRELMQSQWLDPTIAVVWDEASVAAWEAALPARPGAGRLADGLAARRREKSGYPTEAEKALLLLGFEGDGAYVDAQWRRALSVCRGYDATSLGGDAARTWQREQQTWPYLRDTLVSHGIMVDVVGALADWSTLPAVREALVDALRGAVRTGGGGHGFVHTRFTHAGPHGGSLYAAFLGQQVAGDEVEAKVGQWEAVHDAAVEAILSAGGGLCLGWGTGCTRSRWLELQTSPTVLRGLRALKEAFDPTGVMNPGVLAPSGS